jgi:hypothetical protein
VEPKDVLTVTLVAALTAGSVAPYRRGDVYDQPHAHTEEYPGLNVVSGAGLRRVMVDSGASGIARLAYSNLQQNL